MKPANVSGLVIRACALSALTATACSMSQSVLAQSQAQSRAANQSTTQAASQASGQASTHAASQASTQAASQAPNPTRGQTTVTRGTPMTAAGRPAAAAAASDAVALQGPKQIVHQGKTWKENPTYISIKKGQEILPLNLTFTNGGNGMPGVSGLNVSINGRKLCSQADFKGRDTFTIKMDGLLPAGDTQMVVQTYGVPGASVTWVLSTNKIKVSDIKPDTAAIGEKVTISGKNLPTSKTAYQIMVGDKQATIKTATDKQIEFNVPDGVAGGKQAVSLYIAGVKCDPLSIKIKSAGEITGINMVDAPPGTTVQISGKGFSTTPSDNQIMFNGTPGQVTKASATSLDVVVPQIEFPQRDVQITGKVNGTAAKGSTTMNVTIRTIYKDDVAGPGSWSN